MWQKCPDWMELLQQKLSQNNFYLEARKERWYPVYGLVTPTPGVPVYRPQPSVLIGQFVWQPSPYCS